MKKHLSFFVFFVAICLVFKTNIVTASTITGIVPEAAKSVTTMPGGVGSAPVDKNKGIGPIKSIVIGPLDKKMVEEGKGIFNTQCVICHDLDQKKLGPALRNVTKQRTPEFIMNLLLNSAQMQKEDPTIKALLKEYNNLAMPDPALNQAKARSVLEYLRSVAK
ncbi:MAG: cytochrome c [Mariniphaga sp.]